jgi:hypothetical protein
MRSCVNRWTRRSALGVLLLSALTTACVAPDIAVSDTGTTGTEITPSLTPPLGFELRGSNGYSIEVYGQGGQGGSAAQVIVRASTRTASATYHFPGFVEEGSIQADLGAYGQISVGFHAQSGGSGVGELGCSRGLSAERGYYEGTISFHAKGLTAVDASQADGSNGLALSVLCGGGREESRPGTLLEVLGGPSTPSLMVSEDRGGLATQIQARISEDRGVEIERSVSIVASNGALRRKGLRSATFDPPPPFTGSATFGRDGAETSWRGNLRVNFPGRPAVALTGRGVEARLRRTRAR